MSNKWSDICNYANNYFSPMESDAAGRLLRKFRQISCIRGFMILTIAFPRKNPYSPVIFLFYGR